MIHGTFPDTDPPTDSPLLRYGRFAGNDHLADAQTEWFVREVQRHRELGIPLGCCDEWPECSHVLDWYETRGRVELFAQAHGHRAESDSTHCRYCGAAPAYWHRPCTRAEQ